MTGPDQMPPNTAPRFDHVLYGLPGEVPTISTDEEPKRGLLRTRKRKVVAGVVAAVLISGGAGGAYAMHERNLQAGAERSAQQRVGASSVDVALAAEVEEAREALEERLDVAREVYAESREVLLSDDEAQVELRTAISDAEETLRADAPDVVALTEAAEVLERATDAVELAMDREARASLMDALAEARDVLAASDGQVSDDAIRLELGELIDQSQELLETADATPRAMLDQAEELADATRAVSDAVDSYQPEPPPTIDEPALAPPFQREDTRRDSADRDANSSERPDDSSRNRGRGGTDSTPGPRETEAEDDPEIELGDGTETETETEDAVESEEPTAGDEEPGTDPTDDGTEGPAAGED